MDKHRTLHNFTQEQHALNNISDMLNFLFEGDPIKDDPDTFSAMTQKTLDLMKQTDAYEASLKKDPTFLKTVAEAAGIEVDEVVDDLTYLLIHAALAEQSIIIERLTAIIDNN